MKTKIQNLKSFGELISSERESVLGYYREEWVESGWWDWNYIQFREECEKKGFRVDEIYFSGFYSQGDGASFTGSVTDTKKFLTYIRKMVKPQYRMRNVNNCSIEIGRNWGTNYYHAYTMNINTDFFPDRVYQNEEQSLFTEKIEGDILGVMREWARELYKDLEKQWNWITSDEYLIELIESNDYHFDEDLKITNP